MFIPSGLDVEQKQRKVNTMTDAQLQQLFQNDTCYRLWQRDVTYHADGTQTILVKEDEVLVFGGYYKRGRTTPVVYVQVKRTNDNLVHVPAGLLWPV
jgi:hypothetical protein